MHSIRVVSLALELMVIDCDAGFRRDMLHCLYRNCPPQRSWSTVKILLIRPKLIYASCALAAAPSARFRYLTFFESCSFVWH
jgi:hypothetical protein